MQGTSLRPLLDEGDRAPEEAAVVLEWNGLPQQISGSGGVSVAGGEETRMRSVSVLTIRRGRWKLNVHTSEEIELDDLEDDPGEGHNAALEREREGLVADLYERLLAWQRATQDGLALPDPRGGAAPVAGVRHPGSPAPPGRRGVR